MKKAFKSCFLIPTTVFFLAFSVSHIITLFLNKLRYNMKLFEPIYFILELLRTITSTTYISLSALLNYNLEDAQIKYYPLLYSWLFWIIFSIIFYVFSRKHTEKWKKLAIAGVVCLVLGVIIAGGTYSLRFILRGNYIFLYFIMGAHWYGFMIISGVVCIILGLKARKKARLS